MAQILIGKTGISVEKNGFGALPIQRISRDEAVRLLHRAYDGGITYYDTARAYSDSEEKLGAAFSGMRHKVVIATKTGAGSGRELTEQLETSLKKLRTDYIDIYQFHMPQQCPRPGDGSGLYEAMETAQKQGKIRFIGITNHRMDVAQEAISSGLYATLQYPFSYLSTEEEIALVRECLDAGMGFVAMKGLAGGLINNSAAAYAWMEQFPGVIPIWGIQRENELEEFLGHMRQPPALTPELQAVMTADRIQLQGEFCRGCGYCMPCPQGIPINMAARVSLMLRRAPTEISLDSVSQEGMRKIETCLECYQCASKCPYGLDTPKLLKRNYKDYQEVLAGKPLLPHNF